MYKKLNIIDCKDHLLGRLASHIAKLLLRGQKVVAVRCEDINISGSLHRNKLKYAKFLRLRTNTNPRKGPFHLREPDKILWRCVRGMMPHKTKRGNWSLQKFKAFVGVPRPYDKMKRYVIPRAMRALCLKKHRRYCRLGTLSTRVGWNYDELVKQNETRRKEASKVYYEKKLKEKKEENKLKEQALQQLKPEHREILQRFGYA